MKIKTEILKEMVSKSIKGASNNKMIPITSLIGIETGADRLFLYTTDGNNLLQISSKLELNPLEGPTAFYTIVNADIFSKLVGKTTKEYIKLTNKDNYLLFEGNGDYKLDIAINEEGEMVRFPEHDLSNATDAKEISIEKLKSNLNALKPSVAKTMEVPYLTGIYISNKSVATDRQMMCYINTDILDKPILLSYELVELLDLLEGDKVKLLIKDNELMFQTNNIIISGKQLEGKEDYPVEAIEGLVNEKYKSTIEVDKQELLDVLDRMSLFVTEYDKNGVKLAFTKKALLIKSQKSNAEELIDAKSDTETEFNCLVDIEMLKSQVQTINTEKIIICYGQDKSIKLLNGNTIIIISLVEKTN